MIVIVDYGMGNIASILNMYKYIGFKDVRLSNSKEDIQTADRIILPGVGSFDHGMEKLHSSGLIPVLNEEVLVKKKPILGICLGMQLLTKGSEEGKLAGIGWIPAYTYKFVLENKDLKVPHMGWNYINITRQNALLDINIRQRFYFVHSYFVKCEEREDVLATCTYGKTFDCAINRGNIWGTQFHPEKSHKFGMSILKSFATL